MPSRPSTRSIHAAAGTWLAAVALAACAGLPQPPPPLPRLASPRVTAARVDEIATFRPEIAPPRPILPSVRWLPPLPGEGTLVTLIVEPAARGLPILEARARTGDDELRLVPLDGGAYLGLLAAPLAAREIPVEVSVTLIDGTRMTRSRTVTIARREFPVTRLSVDRRFIAPDDQTRRRIERERRLVRAMLRQVSETPLWRGRFIRPKDGRTTSPYGQRRLFNNQQRSRHTGLDIDGDRGDPVYAANSGRVVLARNLFFTGNCVYIDHGLGFYTGYFHLSKREVSEGQWVEKGELIGRVGATGRVTGPHLHWALYLQGAPLDPLSVFDDGFARASQRLARSAAADRASNP